jgi:hypothetical protein
MGGLDAALTGLRACALRASQLLINAAFFNLLLSLEAALALAIPPLPNSWHFLAALVEPQIRKPKGEARKKSEIRRLKSERRVRGLTAGKRPAAPVAKLNQAH